MAGHVDGDARKKLDQLKPLLEKFRQQQAASYETLEEMMQLIGGTMSLVDSLKRLEASYRAFWELRYRSVYAFNYQVDRAQMKRLLKMLPVEEIEARMQRYVRADDPFFKQCRHSFGIFVRSINQFAQDSGAEFLLESEAPIGCTHEPPCASDTQHTTRLNVERRGQPF